MTRKGKASKRQWKKLRAKWAEAPLVRRRFGEDSPREFFFMYRDWPASLG